MRLRCVQCGRRSEAETLISLAVKVHAFHVQSSVLWGGLVGEADWQQKSWTFFEYRTHETSWESNRWRTTHGIAWWGNTATNPWSQPVWPTPKCGHWRLENNLWKTSKSEETTIIDHVQKLPDQCLVITYRSNSWDHLGFSGGSHQSKLPDISAVHYCLQQW